MATMIIDAIYEKLKNHEKYGKKVEELLKYSYPLLK